MVPGVTSTLAAAQSRAVGQIMLSVSSIRSGEMQSSEENVDIIRESRSRCIKYKMQTWREAAMAQIAESAYISGERGED